jgi:hypothetical protein
MRMELEQLQPFNIRAKRRDRQQEQQQGRQERSRQA